MSGWRIVMHDERPESPQVGDCWPATHMLTRHADIYGRQLSPRFFALPEPRRHPLVVRLPGPVDFCVDTKAWNESGYYGDGWQVSGLPDALTLHPSVNVGGIYHGWIRGGVISEDCEGRTFPGVQRTA